MDIQNDIRVTRFLREFNNRLVNEVDQPLSIMKKNSLTILGKILIFYRHRNGCGQERLQYAKETI